jgi:fumarate hydratase class I
VDDAVRDEAVGPVTDATTATRMDKFTEPLLAKTRLFGMVGGEAERGELVIASIKSHGGVYLIAVGGAAYLTSRAIKKSRVVAFADLGMEAIHEFVVEGMPVTVAVDSNGVSIHHTSPRLWQGKENRENPCPY